MFVDIITEALRENKVKAKCGQKMKENVTIQKTLRKCLELAVATP